MAIQDHPVVLPRAISQPAYRWGISDWLIAVLLFCATAGFVLWQNAHVTVLWDLSYILENATRISLGQRPYRDFPFPYAPFTFVVQAAIIKLFGRVVLHHALYAAITGGISSVLTWRIVAYQLMPSRLNGRGTAALLAMPLTFLGTSSIFPHPFYDSDCTLFVLLCIWLLLRLERSQYPPLQTFAIGLLLAVPVFIKQNTGLAFLASALVCIVYFGFRNRRPALLLLGGAGTGFAAALGLIQYTVGLQNYLHWTIQFAASRRLRGMRTMVGIYLRSPLLCIFFAVVIAVLIFRPAARPPALRTLSILLSLPFAWAILTLFAPSDALSKVSGLLLLWPFLLITATALALWQLPRATTLRELLPFILFGTANGAFMSQMVVGSTYAIWPLLIILLASTLANLAPREVLADTKTFTEPERYSIAPLTALSVVASLTLLVSGAYYSISHVRLNYVHLTGDRLEHSSLPALRGLSMRGNWISSFEQLVSFTDQQIPKADPILIIPGEDLFYFSTGRVPQFPVVLLDSTVNPYDAQQIFDLARQRHVNWFIVKRTLQGTHDPVTMRPELLHLLAQDFTLAKSLDNYEIYRRRSG